MSWTYDKTNDLNRTAEDILEAHGFITTHHEKSDGAKPKGGAFFLKFDPGNTDLGWTGIRCKHFLRAANYLPDKLEARAIQDELVRCVRSLKENLGLRSRNIVDIDDFSKDWREYIETQKDWFSDKLSMSIRYKLSTDQLPQSDWDNLRIKATLPSDWHRIGAMNEVASLAPWCDADHHSIPISIRNIKDSKPIASIIETQLARGKRRVLNLYYGGFQGQLICFVSPGGRQSATETGITELDRDRLCNLSLALADFGEKVAADWYRERLQYGIGKLQEAQGTADLLDGLLHVFSPCQRIEVQQIDGPETLRKMLNWDEGIGCWDGYLSEAQRHMKEPLKVSFDLPALNQRYSVLIEPLSNFVGAPGMDRSAIEARLQTLMAMMGRSALVSRSALAPEQPSDQIPISAEKARNWQIDCAKEWNELDGDDKREKDGRDFLAKIAVLGLWLEASACRSDDSIKVKINSGSVRRVLGAAGIPHAEKVRIHPCSHEEKKPYCSFLTSLKVDGRSVVPLVVEKSPKGSQGGFTLALPRLV